ncbi:MAG: EAL domain-containing protein [Pseudomonadota bacterium]|nr:EAL domain-containing protein [Pseudomonadota bacterium]
MLDQVLLVQTDHAGASVIRDALASSRDSSFEVVWVQRCSEGADHLRQYAGVRAAKRVDAILLDLFLVDSQGIETFDALFALAPHVPILVLIAPQDEAIAKLAVQRGAQDYLLKDRLDAYLMPKVLRSMIERAANTEALYDEKERAQVTLNSIGGAVMSTDADGHVTFLNMVAERLTGWSREDAAGRPFEEVFQLVDELTRARVCDPMMRAIRENKTVGLPPNCILVRRDGFEAAIEDSAAPIRDRHGQVTGAVMVFHDVSAARALSLRMSYLAQHDSLTDLPNRLLLNDRLAQAMAAAQRGGTKLGLLYLDLDRFKTINDSLGHGIGDRLLKSVAQRLLGCVRQADTVSRQGGDEFVILLSQLTQGQDAAVSAEKILTALSLPHQIDEHTLYATASIGVVTFPDDGVHADALLKNADFAMYQAKESGRNCYQFFKPEMNAKAAQRQSIENGLRVAIEKQALLLHYQPKFDLRTGAITAVEALVRWRHPTRGVLPPSEFIAVAEESGLIVSLGKWVLREACRQVKRWQDAGLKGIRMAVNISAVELRAKGFVQGVCAILQGTGCDPASLEFELTETFLLQDPTSTASVLRTLKGIGVHLALDDFGTGYSSLSYLRRFPIDTLKIDRSFMHDVVSDGDNASIVRAVISLGRSLHMRVVAEGVETDGQLHFLQEHGCPEGQGYLLSRPAAAKHITRLLELDSTDASRAFSHGQSWTPKASWAI